MCWRWIACARTPSVSALGLGAMAWLVSRLSRRGLPAAAAAWVGIGRLCRRRGWPRRRGFLVVLLEQWRHCAAGAEAVVAAGPGWVSARPLRDWDPGRAGRVAVRWRARGSAW